MAKKKKKSVNVSKSVRDYASANKSAKPKDISAALKKQGIVASPNYVSNILSTAKRAKGKPGRKKRARAAAPVAAGGNISDVIASLVEAKKFAAKVGGIDAARKALDALAKLS